eukprot:CAMPEP_0197185692 /NCGR_PEP_ID=MMETSP1423-20130617/12447_1 /TAXON_ID=476441 /ORGANISM="Pseudo-nitzschia heimii, Strain UNC1101" /LENGTH=254 /DNA_ID=CAMNT_0042636825 /DNA_START=158 /DNA_END=922 /DNA_ORIENTATION=-
MAQMNAGIAGPQWANPHGAPVQQQQSTIAPPTIGTSTVQQHESEFFAPLSTLDEPVKETIMRDVRSVVSKLKVVLLPMERSLPYGGYSGVSQSETIDLTERDKQIIESLRDWDLWGPLVVCLGLAVLLSFKAPMGQASLVFAAVFCAVWFGSAVVTINAQLLGGTISFFQSVCVLGYCVFPMTLAAVVVDLFKILPLGAFSTLVELAVLFVAFLWSTRASAIFIGQYIVPARRILAVFPVLFFYTFLAWLVFLF